VAHQVRERLRHRAEELDLLRRVDRVVVGGREVRHQADDLRAGLPQLRNPPAAHPGVELQVHAHALGDLLVPDRQLELRLPRIGDLAARRGRAHDEDPDQRELLPQLQAFGNGRNAERPGALVDHCPRDVDGAVPVRVRLDHRPELRAFERAQERPRVAADRAEVDRHLTPVHPHALVERR